jgi:EPSP synthase (3-phosphoshikimate 1-carboxyvinyltransferase)
LSERRQRLFAWASAVLKELGFDRTVAAASSIEELYSVTFNDSAEVTLAIRDAPHPTSGPCQERQSQANSQKLMRRLTELRVKESNRLAAVAEGLRQNGVEVAVAGDDLMVAGNGRPPGGGSVTTHMDHRIAMAFLVMGSRAKRPSPSTTPPSLPPAFPPSCPSCAGSAAS